jgi:hypothetical protein
VWSVVFKIRNVGENIKGNEIMDASAFFGSGGGSQLEGKNN